MGLEYGCAYRFRYINFIYRVKLDFQNCVYINSIQIEMVTVAKRNTKSTQNEKMKNWIRYIKTPTKNERNQIEFIPTEKKAGKISLSLRTFSIYELNNAVKVNCSLIVSTCQKRKPTSALTKCHKQQFLVKTCVCSEFCDDGNVRKNLHIVHAE